MIWFYCSSMLGLKLNHVSKKGSWVPYNTIMTPLLPSVYHVKLSKFILLNFVPTSMLNRHKIRCRIKRALCQNNTFYLVYSRTAHSVYGSRIKESINTFPWLFLSRLYLLLDHWPQPRINEKNTQNPKPCEKYPKTCTNKPLIYAAP